MRVGGACGQWPTLSQNKAGEHVKASDYFSYVEGQVLTELLRSFRVLIDAPDDKLWWLLHAHTSKKINGNMTSQAFKTTSTHSKSAIGKSQMDAVKRSKINSRRLQTATNANWETNSQGLLTTPPIRPAASSTHAPPRLM